MSSITQDSAPRTQDFSGVAVTGLGILSPLGIGHERFWRAVCAGQSGIRPLPGADRVPHLAGQLVDFLPREFITSAHVRRMDRLSRIIVSASRMALADAKLRDADAASDRVGIVVGSALGNISESVQYLQRVFTKGPALASPMMFPNLVLNAPASYAAMDLGSSGANFTVSQGEISGEQAIALGCDLIRSNRADIVLAGGGDEIDAIVIAAYRTFRALSSQRGGDEWCSPYDVARNGVVLGEGSAMLVLESAQGARQRGATIYAEIEDHLSFGVPAPPYDWPQRAPSAPGRLRDWLGRSLPPRATIDLACGAANSSRRLDACELDVLARLFGETAAQVTVTSIKGATGEFGAAGALTAVAVCLALHHGVVPPLCHLRHPPPEAPFQFAAGAARTRPLQRALLFSIARGGAAIALLVRRATA